MPQPVVAHGPARDHSRTLRNVVTVAVVALAVLLVLERFSAVVVAAIQGASDWWPRLLAQAFAAIPEALYLAALWWVRQALAAIADGDPFAGTVVRTLHGVGVLLAVASVIDLCVVPGAQTLVGRGPGYLIAYDVGGIALAAVGASLTVLAQALRRAADLKAELDEMF